MIFERCLIDVINKLNEEIDINDPTSDSTIKNQLSLLRNNYTFNIKSSSASRSEKNNKITKDLNVLLELFKGKNDIPNKDQYAGVLTWYLNIIKCLENLKVTEKDLQYFQSLKSNKLYGVVYNVQILPFKIYSQFNNVRSYGLMNMINKKRNGLSYQIVLNLLYGKINTNIAVLKQRKHDLLSILEKSIQNYEKSSGDLSLGADSSMTVSEIIESLQPSTLEKWWLPLLIASQYLPYKMTQIWLNRVRIAKFVQHEVIDFTKGLVINWIIQPSIKIWKTISHSETDSLISNKDTMKVEYDSMIRMMQNVASKGSVTAAGTANSVDAIEQSFFQNYEKQVQNPWMNIMNGGLIQSVLVLIQRAKVEADFGLNSIDKILQSQQLVFQFVAISPAFLTVWVIYNFLIKPIFYNAPFFAFKKIFSFFNRDSLTVNDHYLIYLNKLMKFINDKEFEKQDSLKEDESFIYDLDNFGEYGLKYIPKKRLSDWENDIFHVFHERFNFPLVRMEFQRLDRTYGKYFK